MSANLSQLTDELTTELAHFKRVKDDVFDAQHRLGSRGPEQYDLHAVGSILHNLYQIMEDICQRVFKNIDQQSISGGSELRSDQWHSDLMTRMSQPLQGVRPAVIQPATVEAMEAYRGFRHVFRHVYGFDLDWARMKPLLDNAVPMIESFTADIEQFIAFLKMMADSQDLD